MTSDDGSEARCASYAAEVRRALDDLPAARYLELVDGLDGHLAEIASDGADLDELLGTPERYAAELRSSAGLAARRDTERPVATNAGNERRRRRSVDHRHLAALVLVVSAGVLVRLLAPRPYPSAGRVLALAATVTGGMAVVWLLVALTGVRGAARSALLACVATAGVTVASLIGLGNTEYVYLQRTEGGVLALTPYGPIAVPDFTAMNRAVALDTAIKNQLNVRFEQATASDVIVVAQRPAPGATVMTGASVTLVLGPAPVDEQTEPAPTPSSTVP